MPWPQAAECNMITTNKRAIVVVELVSPTRSVFVDWLQNFVLAIKLSIS
jgi:hypothetical protein